MSIYLGSQKISAYAGGQKVAEDVTPEVSTQTPIIEEIIEGLVGKTQGATASAETILEGFSAYVGGKLVDGTFKKDECLDALFVGDFTVGAVDKFTFAENMNPNSFGYTGNYVPFNHSLGTRPRMAILSGKNITKDDSNFASPYLLTAITFCRSNSGDYYASIIRKIGHNFNPSNDGVMDVSNETRYESSIPSSDTQVPIYLGSGTYLESGKEYTLITMA